MSETEICGRSGVNYPPRYNHPNPSEVEHFCRLPAEVEYAVGERWGCWCGQQWQIGRRWSDTYWYRVRSA